MPFWFALLLFSVSTVLGQLFRPKTTSPKPATLAELDFPTAEETRAIPKGYGTFLMKAPNVVSVTDFSSEPIKSKVDALQKILSFGMAKKQTIGYKYYCGIEMALCYRVDAITQIIIGDKIAWSGNVTTDSEIYINQPKLFGGDDSASGGNGGIVGYVGIHVGLPNASKDAYLVSQYGNYSAHRGVCYAVLKGQKRAKGSGYVGNSTRIEAWQFVGKFIPNNLPYATYGYSNYSDINSGDANPAEVLYDILRSAEYAIGMPQQYVDLQSFTKAAKTFYDDGIGFSALWDSAKPCRDLINNILQLTDSVLYSDLQTGKLVLAPARADYVVADLPHFTDDDIIAIDSYTRGAWAETTNEVKVPFVNRLDNFIDQNGQAQDLANQKLQGATVSANVQHVGISNPTTAANIAQRDLRAMTTPLAKTSFQVNLKAYKTVPGGVFKWSTNKIKDHNGNPISAMIMRCNGLKIGNPRNPLIQIEAIEDVFNTATAVQAVPPSPGGGSVVTAPVATTTYVLDELPFMLASADVAAFLWAMAAAPNTGSYTFDMITSGDNVTYEDDDSNNQFTPTGLLNTAYGSATAAVDNSHAFVVTGAGSSNLDRLTSATASEIANGNNLMLVVEGSKSEIMAFESYTVDGSGNYVFNNVWRGLLDTTPQSFTSAARVWFFSYGDARGDNGFAAGATAYAKLLTRTLAGVLDEGTATALNRTMGVRALRPYAPGNIRINGTYNGAIPSSGDITVAWSHRDRSRQGTVIAQNNTATPGIEGGAVYTLKIYNQAGTLLRTVTSISTSYVYTNVQETADNGGSLADALTFMLYTTRDGITSHQAQIRGSARVGSTIYSPAYAPSGTYAAPTSGSTINGVPVSGNPTSTNNVPTYNPTTGQIEWQPGGGLPDLTPSPAGVYGAADKVPQITVDAKGRVTAVTPVDVVTGTQTVTEFSDNFDDNSIDAAKWVTSGSGISETSQKLVINNTSSSHLRSISPFNCVSKTVTVKAVTVPTSSTNLDFQLLLANNDSFGTFYMIDVNGTDLRWFANSGLLGSTTYNPATDKWFRIRFSSTTVYFETSADGETWTTKGSSTTITGASSLYIYLRLYNATGGAALAEWDYLALTYQQSTTGFTKWFSGAGAPDNANGTNGDFYLNSSNYDYYKKISGSWVLQGNLKGADGAPGAPGGQPSRVTVNLTTASLADTIEGTGTVALGKSIRITKIVADRYCRIRLYKTAAHRTADALRAFGIRTYLGTNHGIICDIKLTAGTGLTWQCSPDVVGSNGDTPPTTAIYYAVQNLSGSTSTVSIDFTLLQDEN